ncbi:hypothetical protein NQ314_005966 [Rhamnusium bicolor]|uniref:Secreted protein n=1 Tax=Rhamnusium bicolor TaxID=1586634 RepID=A0AAV8ZBR7_9CUCU|nr:hypothetical protein NQ314_005966 [Rhamnusium bicolor]
MYGLFCCSLNIVLHKFLLTLALWVLRFAVLLLQASNQKHSPLQETRGLLIKWELCTDTILQNAPTYNK